MRTMIRIVSVLLFASITLFGCLHAAASEPISCEGPLKGSVPKFRVAHQDQNQSLQGMVLFLSVAQRDIAQDKLLTLVCSVARTHAKNQSLVVWVLDDHKAAKQFNPQGEGNTAAIEAALRASYGFDREKNDQSFMWYPERGNRTKTVDIKMAPPPPMPTP